MVLLYNLGNLFTLINNILLEKINSFNLSLSMYKYYILIAIFFLSSSIIVFIPIFCESQNASTTILNSNDIELLYDKANDFYSQQTYDEAIQYYDKVLAIDPSYVDALNNKAIVLKNLQKYDEAIQYYDKVLAIDPSYVDALNNKANALKN